MDFTLLTPELTLLVTAIAVILLDLFISRKGFLTVVSLLGLAIATVFTFGLRDDLSQAAFSKMLAVDNFAFFFKLLFIGIAAMVIIASTDYVSKFKNFRGEYHALILIATLGMMLMAATTELITVYVSLEVASISLYALSGFLKDGKSSESAVKYMILGAVSSAVLLYGMALVFGVTGKTQIGEIAASIQLSGYSNLLDNPALIMGIVLLVAGFGFKIAAIPFQMWVPDVYEGAPTPVVGFLSVGSKAAGFAIIVRLFFTAFEFPESLSLDWGAIYAVLAIAGMIIGNASAIAQSNIKRLLGYSSIAQAGYLLVGLATLGIAPANEVIGRSSILFFLISYALANLGAFVAIIAISNKIESDEIKDYAGIGKRAPVLALCLTVCLISLIGMLPTAGFMAKFYIFNGAVQNGLLWLVIIAVLNSVISAFYYLRVVKAMWFNEPASLEKVPSSGALRFSLLITTLGVLFMGIVPNLLLTFAEWAARILRF
ncbi:MAG: NADH-quinone oxidoreductase subunit N [Dehalococcoidales bacterium]|nr:NADH-quinone oxidoreductase subunit N [Dehalococcoidales bacterium]